MPAGFHRSEKVYKGRDFPSRLATFERAKKTGEKRGGFEVETDVMDRLSLGEEALLVGCLDGSRVMLP